MRGNGISIPLITTAGIVPGIIIQPMTRLLPRDVYEEFVKELPPDRCPLCDANRQIVLGTSTHWLWIAGLSPYWRYHTMFIPKKHIEDITELNADEFSELQTFYSRTKKHLLSLELKHADGKVMDQFMLLIRKREDNVEDGSTYPKPRHLHIHFIPDHEGVDRFILDETAIDIDIEKIALPE